jgi:hypothetical protein
MGRVIPAGEVNWRGLFDRSEHTWFRLQTRQWYDEPGEADALAAFLTGQEPEIYPGKKTWLEMVRAAAAVGKVMQRVHVVAEPLTEYLQFEIGWSYPLNAAAGEDIRISRAISALPGTDYWLFDSRALARLRYNPAGRLTAVELDDDPATVVHAGYWRDVALHLALPLHSWRRPADPPG